LFRTAIGERDSQKRRISNLELVEARPKAFVLSAGAFEAPAGNAGT
jgi:hypothetical protein